MKQSQLSIYKAIDRVITPFIGGRDPSCTRMNTMKVPKLLPWFLLWQKYIVFARTYHAQIRANISLIWFLTSGVVLPFCCGKSYHLRGLTHEETCWEFFLVILDFQNKTGQRCWILSRSKRICFDVEMCQRNSPNDGTSYGSYGKISPKRTNKSK